MRVGSIFRFVSFRQGIQSLLFRVDKGGFLLGGEKFGMKQNVKNFWNSLENKGKSSAFCKLRIGFTLCSFNRSVFSYGSPITINKSRKKNPLEGSDKNKLT